MSDATQFLTAAELAIRDMFSTTGPDASDEYIAFIRSFLDLGRPVAEKFVDTYGAVLDAPDAARSRLLFMAAEEASGAAAISYFARWGDETLASEMARHSTDEERHMKMLLGAAHAFSPERRKYEPIVVGTAEMDGAGPEDLVGFMCNVHQAEVRIYASFLVVRELASSRSDKAHSYLAHMCSTIMADELQHILYTGRHVERWSRDGAVSYSGLVAGFPQYSAFWDADVSHLERCLTDPTASPFHPRLGIS